MSNSTHTDLTPSRPVAQPQPSSSTLPIERNGGHVSGPSTPNGVPSPRPQATHEEITEEATPAPAAGPSRIPPPDDPYARSIGNSKRKWGLMGFDEDERTYLESIALSYQLALAQDQADTLYPERPTAFTSKSDVVEKLLPYHIWQIHDEELEGRPLDPKKESIREQRELKDAADLVRRISDVKDRFTKLRRREGLHPSHLPSVISVIHSSTNALREELAVVQTNLKSARAEYDSLEAVRREKERVKAAALAASASPAQIRPPPAQTPSRPQTPQTPQPRAVATPVTRPTPTPSPAVTTAAARTPVSASNSAPSTPNTDARGRTRGRTFRGPVKGLREAVLTQTTSVPSPSPQTPANKSSPVPATPAKSGTSTSASSQNPVNITVSMGIIPQFVNLGLIVLPSTPNQTPKPPATIIKTTEDKKSVVLSINLSACTQVQLQGLAKLLNVTAKPAAVAAAAGATSSASPAST